MGVFRTVFNSIFLHCRLMQCNQSFDLLQSWQKPVPLGFYSTQYETIQLYGLSNFLVGISGSRNYRMQFGNMIYYNVRYSCNVCSEVSIAKLHEQAFRVSGYNNERKACNFQTFQSGLGTKEKNEIFVM